MEISEADVDRAFADNFATLRQRLKVDEGEIKRRALDHTNDGSAPHKATAHETPSKAVD